MTALGADIYKNAALDAMLGTGHFSAFPATVYGALVDGAGAELSGTGYARVAITNNTANFPAAAGGQKLNGAAFAFPTAGASWGTAVTMKLMDASTAGNELCHGALTTPLPVASGETPTVAIGQWSLRAA